MTCDEARPLLDPLYDGALNSKDTAFILEHLKSCRDCDQEWHEMEKLRERFQSARNSTAIPAGLTERIASTLNNEDSSNRGHFIRRHMNVMPFWLVAAAILLVGLFALPKFAAPNLNQQRGEAVLASIDSMVEDSEQNAGFEKLSDAHELPEKLGFEPKFIKMTGWQMQQASVYKSPAHSKIAKFDFASTKYGERLYCYQAMQGSIGPGKIEPVNVAGKNVRFGQRGKYQFALWSQNGRDYLIVTPLPKETLTEIVSSA